MNPIWQDLFINFAIATLFISVWRHFRHSVVSVGLVWRRIVFGLLMGAGTVTSMYLSVEVADGVIFDLRNSVVVVAAGFGGPIGGAIAALIAAAYRIWLGGAGMSAGVSGIALAAALGMVIFISRMGKPTRHWHVLAMAIGAPVVFLISTAGLPFGWGSSAFATVSVPVSVMLLLATFAMGTLLLSSQRSSRERDLLRAATMQSPDFYYIKDTGSRFVATNLATAQINGFKTIKSILGKSDFDLDQSDRADRLFEAEQELMKSGEASLDFEEKVEQSDGVRWYSTSKVPLRSPDGQVIGMVGISSDITEKKQLENSLAQTKNRLSFALSEMSDGLAMFDKNACLIFSNERYLSMFPLTANVRVPGTPLAEILKEVVKTGEQLTAGSADESNMWIDNIVDNLHQNTEEQAQMYDGRWLSIRTRPSRGGSSMVLVTDITQAKLAEMELIRSAERLKMLAETDGLTDLSNRRSFDSALQIGTRKAQENRSKLSLLMIDIDHFKSYNDTLGHAAGDECLRQVAKCLQDCVSRSIDVVARYGGEEFALVLVGTDIAGAEIVAEKVHARLAEANLSHAASPLGRVTVSIGAATLLYGAEVDTPQNLIDRADKALYRAKRSGRNGTATWEPDTDQREVG